MVKFWSLVQAPMQTPIVLDGRLSLGSGISIDTFRKPIRMSQEIFRLSQVTWCASGGRFE